MSRPTPTTANAMEAWSELAMKNDRTDAAVNNLLEEIAGSKYLTGEQDDDPIYHTIENLTDMERRVFLDGCEEIREQEAAAQKIRIRKLEARVERIMMLEAQERYRLPDASTPEQLELDGFTVIRYGREIITIGYRYDSKNPKNGYYAAVFLFEEDDKRDVDDTVELEWVSTKQYADEGNAIKAAFER